MPSSEEACSVLLPVLVMVVMRRYIKFKADIHLLFRQLERLHVVTDDLQFLLQLDNFATNNTEQKLSTSPHSCYRTLNTLCKHRLLHSAPPFIGEILCIIICCFTGSAQSCAV